MQIFDSMKEYFMKNWVTILWVVIPIAVALLITVFIRRKTIAGLKNPLTKLNSMDEMKTLNARFALNGLITLVWIVTVVIIVSRFQGLNGIATALLSGSGIAAVILGLAAQESFSNLFSGLFITIYKPFNLGDRIRIDGTDNAGYVEDINLRHTVLRARNNARILVPNSVLAKASIENGSFANGAGGKIEVSIAYEGREKRHRALEIMDEVVRSHPLYFDPRTEDEKAAGVPQDKAICTGFGASGVNLEVLMWTEHFSDNMVACSDCRMKILDRFEEEGIEIPYSKLVVFSGKED